MESIPFPGRLAAEVVRIDRSRCLHRYDRTDASPCADPSATEALTDAGLLPNALYYRHDWAFAQDPTIPKNPHLVVVSPTAPNALFRSVSHGAQAQIADFHASGGLIVNVPEPAVFWEVPLFERPDSLNFIR